jgi:hypothetical protein
MIELRARRTAEQHFRLLVYGEALRLRERLGAAGGAFPFLDAYAAETGDAVSEAWDAAVAAWEAGGDALPATELVRAAGLEREELALLVSIGLVEEDARFGLVFEGATGNARPTPALLASWGGEAARRGLSRLTRLGLVDAEGGGVRPAPLVWDALRGEPPPTLRLRRPEELTPLEDLIVPPHVAELLATAPAALAAGEVGAIVIRGPRAGGRRTTVGALARALGRGVLDAHLDRWPSLGPLATLLQAVPVLALELAPGEVAEVPRLFAYDGPAAVVLGRDGGVTGTALEQSVTIELPLPGRDERRAHWRRSLGRDGDELARPRMTGGNIRRVARLAHARAALAGRSEAADADVAAAASELHRRLLDDLAERVTTGGDWTQLAAGPATLTELILLESRCRNRERLDLEAGPALAGRLGAGVRALFTGPSGTGKTLAARLLASVLGADLYRLDLSSVVNKYLGETEKNLSRIFARAEEADVALLLDEGDALLTQRTSVQTANDRYANLETNYLLQRLESFEGILIVTTNAGERIDDAFRRRMDVVVEFRPPDALERWQIWDLHLPAKHEVDERFLEEVSTRCALTGGQIRNAVLHASLLALDDGRAVTSLDLRASVEREYRKSGDLCPLRGSELLVG